MPSHNSFSQTTGRNYFRRTVGAHLCNGHTGMRNSHPHANVQNICNSAQRSQYGQRHQAPAMGSVSNNVTGNESHSEYNPYEDHEMEGELALHDIGYSAEPDANSNTLRPGYDNKSQVAQISAEVSYVPQDGVNGRNIFVAVNPTSETVGTPLNTSAPPPPMTSAYNNVATVLSSEWVAPTDGHQHAAFNNMDSIGVPTESACNDAASLQPAPQSQMTASVDHQRTIGVPITGCEEMPKFELNLTREINGQITTECYDLVPTFKGYVYPQPTAKCHQEVQAPTEIILKRMTYTLPEPLENQAKSLAALPRKPHANEITELSEDQLSKERKLFNQRLSNLRKTISYKILYDENVQLKAQLKKNNIAVGNSNVTLSVEKGKPSTAILNMSFLPSPSVDNTCDDPPESAHNQ